VPFICPVDDIAQADNNPSYDEANAVLKKVSSALCLGLSDTGIVSSNLEFDSIKSIYSSGQTKTLDNFIPIGKYALPIFEGLKVKC